MSNYAGELIHLVICLKKIQSQKIKKAQIDYYLINILRRANKFFANDWFGEAIIKKK